MKNIAVIGAGYVGLVTGACFADLGNKVQCLDIDKNRINNLKKGVLPIYEPGLEEIIKRNIDANRLEFTTDYKSTIKNNEFAFIAVGTPEGVDGEADLQYVRQAATEIAKHMEESIIIVNKSTVPVGTGDWVADIINDSQTKPIPFSVVSCPEFLREGNAIQDFMNPHRTVLGSLDAFAADQVAQLHLPLRSPIIITDLRTAEMIKYASNAFLATKISFINEIANICEALGADIKEVAVGMGSDPRIGSAFLEAGIGYGGSCFPKDVKALAHMASEKGSHPQLLNSVMDINADARLKTLNLLKELLGPDLTSTTIGLLGLAFKPNTDDVREAPSLEIISNLIKDGANVKAYDPVAIPSASKIIPNITYSNNPYELADGCDALIVVTEWNEFKQLDLDQILTAMSGNIIIDGRNIYSPKNMHKQGFVYRGIGRSYKNRLKN